MTDQPKKRGRPTKTQEDATYAPPHGYTITKPHEQYIVRLGGSVVYAAYTEEQALEYVGMASGQR